MKKRLGSIVLVSLLFSVVLAGCGSKEKSESGTVQETKAEQVAGDDDAEEDSTRETTENGKEEMQGNTTDTDEQEKIQGNTADTDKKEVPAGKKSYSVWNAYWNLQGAEAQIEELAEHVKNINYFAAYFDKDDKVFIPKETTEFYKKTKDSYRERGWELYLTVVNDEILSDGSSDLKTTKLLYRLLASEESYKAHAEELLGLALQDGYDGLEIDYENLRKEEQLWELFMPFVSYLYERCEEEGVKLRIVIETGIQPDKIEWVEGPIYCVMCYNLYGSHSGPGPKADKEFLTQIMEKMEAVPGNVDYALANGGFDWCEDGSVAGITTTKAEALLAETKAVVQRDEGSAVQYFSYTDGDGKNHDVWYADEETMNIWMEWLMEKGNYQFSIWRVGE